MSINPDDLKNPVYLDPATKIYNRAAYAVFMPQLLEDAKKQGQPLTISILDIDNFKKFNEDFGWAAGDQKVAELIQNLQAKIKESNYIFKYGGDELVFVFVNRVLQIVSQTIVPKIRMVLNQVGLEASIGTIDMQEGDSTSTMFDRADNLMHEEKNSKKNLNNG